MTFRVNRFVWFIWAMSKDVALFCVFYEIWKVAYRLYQTL